MSATSAPAIMIAAQLGLVVGQLARPGPEGGRSGGTLFGSRPPWTHSGAPARSLPARLGVMPICVRLGCRGPTVRRRRGTGPSRREATSGAALAGMVPQVSVTNEPACLT